MLSNTVQLQADITKRISGRIGYMYEDRVITDTGYFGGTVDYYEATNHIPRTRTQLTIRVEREARRRTISWQRADYAQFHPDRARFPLAAP